MSQNREVILPTTEVAPQKALSNIREAEQENLNPDAYVDLETELKENPREPTATVSEPVADAMTTSDQHTQVMKEDVSKLGKMDKLFSYTKLVFEGKSLNDELATLSYRRSTGERLTEDEEFRILVLNSQAQDLQKAKDEYDFSFADSFPAEVVGASYDLADTFRDNYGLILGAGVVGAGAGAGVGALSFTPVGVLAGSLLGGTKGLAAGTGAAFIKHTYIQTTGQIYNELTYSSEENLPEQTKVSIARGAGALSAAVTLMLPVAKFAKNTPFIKKILNPKAYVREALKNPASRSLLMRLAGSTAAAEAGEESIQEVIQVFAGELGKTWDGTETSFNEALERTATMDTAERAAKAAALGGVAGQTMQTGLNLATAPLNRVMGEFGAIQAAKSDVTSAGQIPTNAKGVRAVQLKHALDQHLKLTEDTNTKTMLPEKMAEIRQKHFEDAGTAAIYVDKEELNAWADSDEKAKIALEMLGPEGIAASEIDSPLRIETHKFLKIAEDHPEITNLVKADPTGPSAMTFLMNIEDINKRREQVVSEIDKEIGAPETDAVEATAKNRIELHLELLKKEKLKADPERITEIDKSIKVLDKQLADLEDVELGEQRIRDGDISGEEAFLEQPTFTKDMEDVIPAKEILGLNEAEINARVEVVDNIKADIEAEVAIDLNARYEAKFIEEQDRATKEHGPNVEVVESFLNNDKIIGELSPEQIKLAKKNLPIHSIDPALLTPRLRLKYEDDPVMVARKVFRKGGMHPEQVATIYNQESVENFLKVIAETPTREQLINTELENIENNIKEDTETISEIDDTKLNKAFDKISKLHLKTGKILRDAYWSKFKKGVKRIATDITRLEKQLQKRAKESIGKTKVSTINVDQWVVAARRSQRKAVTAFLDGKFEEGFRQKQNAAYATQLVKEARIANTKVNKARQYIVKVTTDPRYRAELREAGSNYTGAIAYFTDVFNFSPNKKVQSDIKQYQKYLKELEERSEVDQAIPPEVLAWLEPQANPNDLTVDQLLYVANKMKTVMHTARLKNRLYDKRESNTIEMIADNLHENALTNPAYKDERLNEPIGIVPKNYRVGQALSISESLITNNQFLVQELDQGKLNGLNAKLLHQPITGVGESEGPTGLVAKAKLLGAYSKRFRDAIKKHYKSQKAFRNLGITVVNIPELAHLPGSKGKFTKDQLLQMLANMGNLENRAYVENFGVDSDAMMDILRTHLSDRDFAFVQDGMLDAFKTLAPRIDAVHKSTEGVNLDFVKPEPFTGPDGTVYPGGYFPIMIDKELNFIEETQLLKQRITDVENLNPLKKVNANFNSPAYEGIVRSPHTKERVGSEYTISLDMNRFSKALDEVIHDITMREPVRDVMTLLNDQTIKEDIIKQIGRIKYNTLVNNVAQLTNSASSNNLQLHGKLQSGMSKVFSKVEGAFAINYIAFNVNSILMSSLALPQIALKMGPKNFAKYGSQVALKIGGAAARFNKRVFLEAYNLAAELDPSLELYRHGIDDYVESAMSKDIPKQRIVNWKTYAAVKHGQEAAVEFSFTRILGGLDTIMKVYTTVAAYNMYIAGDAKGHNYHDVHHGKTQEEVHRDAKAYVGQLLENTTMRASQYDKAALQNNSLGRQFTRFWNESRNVINNAIAEGRSIKGDANKMVDHARAGNYMDANLAFSDVGGSMMTIFGIMMASQAFINGARERDPFLTPEDKDEGEEGTLGGFIGYHLSNPAELAINYVGSTTPIIRDILYAADSADRDATPRFAVSIPLLAGFNDVATAVNLPGIILTEIQDGATFMEAMGELKLKEQRALINSVGYMVGGVPGANQLLKTQAWMEDEGIELGVPNLNFANQEFVKNVDAYTSSKRPNEEAEFQKLLELSEQGVTTLDDAMLADLELIRNQIAPLPKGEVLSQHGYDIIKHAESNGRWNATPGGSGAYGIYQFTEATWKLMMATPEGRKAGLTLNGRFSKRPGQQEAAMRILTKHNALILTKNNVPLNLETLYFAHHFGAGKAHLVYGKADKIKLSKTLMTPKVLKANPQLVRDGVKNVGNMKMYIKRALRRGEKSLTNTQP